MPQYLKWFKRLDKILTSADGKAIEIWEFNYQLDNTVLSDWATHFRNQYCDDKYIDEYRDGDQFGKTREEYLLNRIFPDKTENFGPATRSGDFGELLIADLLEYLEDYWVPRTRYDNKTTRNSSTQGSDVLAIKLASDKDFSPKDELLVTEVKAQFSGKEAEDRLQDAVDDSNKDPTRKGESLNAIKRRYINEGNEKLADIIKRFQNPLDNKYLEEYAAAALFSDSVYDEGRIILTDCQDHTERDNLRLIIIHGKNMMQLVHSLYERAAHEA